MPSMKNEYAKHWAAPSMEPKRSHRFVLYIGAAKPFVIKKVSNPAYTVAETPHKFKNYTFWYPGKVEWEPVQITCLDPGGDDDTGLSLSNALLAGGYMEPDKEITTGQGMDSTVSKVRAVSAAGGHAMKIVQYGPDQFSDTGNAVVGNRGGMEKLSTWSLKNAWIQKVNFGELNYDNDTMVESTITVRYDWATYTKH